MSMLLLLLTFVLAFFLSLYGVPLARQAALKHQLVDRPDGRLKQQREPVPYLGGLALYLAFIGSLAFTFEFRQDVLGVLLAGTLVVMLGLIDDLGVLSPGKKLAGQLVAVFVLIKSGIRIEIAALPDWLDLGLTVLWMIGMINAFNLLDIMDGLAAGIGFIAAAFLFLVAVLNGDSTIAFLLAALGGSLLGFLRYNWHPAKIYMGDTGALFLGFILGALAMIGQYSRLHDLGLLAPVFILGIPIFDTFFVMYVRLAHRLPVYLGSPDHVALRLRQWGLPVPQVIGVMWLGAATLGGLGVAMMFLPIEAAFMIAALVVLALTALAWILHRAGQPLTGYPFRRGTRSHECPLGKMPAESESAP
jgi:UDP-GlcNAc:undecaprenyl-phosphate GlcNAc-1-phosphate transferase